jgi:mono/diheme cytochrome c family protein
MRLFPFAFPRALRYAAPALQAAMLAAALIASFPNNSLAQQQPDKPPGGEAAKTEDEQPQEVDGETLFATSCGWCHQQGGRVAGRGPKLAGSKKDDAYIVNRIKYGKKGAMPSFEKTFNDFQIVSILQYIRSLPVDE